LWTHQLRLQNAKAIVGCLIQISPAIPLSVLLKWTKTPAYGCGFIQMSVPWFSLMC
jgi:hypothetical protein